MSKKLSTLLGCKDILKLEQFKKRIAEENEDSFSNVEEPLFGGIVNFRDHNGKYVTGYMLVSPNISKYHTYAIDFYTLEGCAPKGEHPLESMKFKDIEIGETYTAFIDWQSFESYSHILALVCSPEVNTLFVPTIKLHDSKKKKYSLSVHLNGVEIKPASNRIVTNANKSVYCIEYDDSKSLISKLLTKSKELTLTFDPLSNKKLNKLVFNLKGFTESLDGAYEATLSLNDDTYNKRLVTSDLLVKVDCVNTTNNELTLGTFDKEYIYYYCDELAKLLINLYSSVLNMTELEWLMFVNKFKQLIAVLQFYHNDKHQNMDSLKFYSEVVKEVLSILK